MKPFKRQWLTGPEMVINDAKYGGKIMFHVSRQMMLNSGIIAERVAYITVMSLRSHP